jgi:endoglucanase
MPPDEGIKTLSLEILKGLGECPAVSFMEGAVASYIQRFLQDLGLSVETDRHGNLITHLEGGNSSPEGQPPIAFMAHMDHPGFEAVEEREGMVIARALGGVPQACFSQGIPVQVVMPDGGRLLGETSGSYGRESERMIAIQLREPRNLEFPRPVVYDLPDFHFDGDMVRMRALDDLAGCASILVAMQTLASEERAGDVYGVFTRAEEVGLIGARLLAEDGRLPADTLVVSLESSRTLPGAVIGEGPVIRVGDATFTFDAEAEGALIKAREELTERRADFKAQRQLMSGGTCEASGFRYYGYRTTGIAFPLGNYHNATPEGGVGAEYIHIDDFVGGVELIVQAARSVARRRESRPWLRMRDIPQEYRQRLSDTRDTF